MKARLALAVCLFASITLSQDAERESLVQFLAKMDAGATSVTAWKGTIRDTVDRKGTFIPAEATELQLDLKAYKGEDPRRGVVTRIIQILPNGSFVNEGDVIARLDTTAIDRKIESERMSLAAAEMGMRHAEEGFRMKSDSDAASLAKAEREAGRANKKLRGFREHEKEFNDESERMSVQYRRHRLEDQKDELDQLEKMYGEDELVDATEEIVLKRSRRNFARSQQNNDLTERRRLYRKEWFEEWREEDLETDAANRARSLEQLRKKQDMGRESAETSLKKQRWGLERQRESFADLQRDREQFVIRAPRRGILLHGRADATTWGEIEEGATLRNRTVFATIGDAKKFKVKTDIPEEDILKVKSGTAVEVVPTAAKDIRMMGRLDVDYLPTKGAKGRVFQAIVHLAKSELRLRPGLTCKVKVILQEERDAILVPKAALAKKDGGYIVRCAKTEDGPVVERVVVTGLSDGKNIVIKEGIDAGEHVVVPGSGEKKGK